MFLDKEIHYRKTISPSSLDRFFGRSATAFFWFTYAPTRLFFFGAFDIQLLSDNDGLLTFTNPLHLLPLVLSISAPFNFRHQNNRRVDAGDSEDRVTMTSVLEPRPRGGEFVGIGFCLQIGVRYKLPYLTVQSKKINTES